MRITIVRLTSRLITFNPKKPVATFDVYYFAAGGGRRYCQISGQDPDEIRRYIEERLGQVDTIIEK